MQRREFLSVSGVLMAGFAGCTSTGTGTISPTRTASPTATPEGGDIKVEFVTKTPPPERPLSERQNQLGDTFITHERLSVKIDGVRSVDRIEVQQQYDLITPSDSGQQLLLVHITTENLAEDSQAPPYPSEFLLQEGNSQYSTRELTDAGLRVTGAEPVNLDEGFFGGQSRILPGVELAGWLLFDVPESVMNFDVVWDRSGGYMGIEDRKPVYWSASLG